MLAGVNKFCGHIAAFNLFDILWCALHLIFSTMKSFDDFYGIYMCVCELLYTFKEVIFLASPLKFSL